MPSTQDKRLPSVGTVFRSVDAFRLACFEVAASVSFRLHVFRAPSASRPKSELRCVELATKKQAPTSGRKCRCVVKAEKRRDGSLVVEEVHRGHSCGFDPASPAGAAARKEMERRLDALREQLRDHADGEEVVDELQSSSESADDFASSSSPTKDGVRARSKPEKPDDGKRAYLSLDDAAKSPYPTKRASRAEVAELVQAGDVELPTLNAPFPSSSAFFTRIWAYAEQRGFPVERDAKHGTLFSTLLVQGGVSSTSDLADLLFFEDSSLGGFVDRVKLQTGVSDHDASRFKAMLREAKRVFTDG
ncbi:hypothetical protein JCM10213v2_002093 [Rhodosporidiobolus nylandii]